MELINLAWTCILECNLRCKHCYAIDTSVRQAPKPLSGNLAKTRIINPLRQMNARFISFTGGEPLIREDLSELMSYAKQCGIGVSLATNGLLLPEKEAILSNHLVDSIQISMESYLKSTNDAIRGDGVYDRLLNDVFPLLRRYNTPFSIAMTPTAANYEDIEGLALLAEDCGAAALVIRRFLALGNANKTDERIFSNKQAHKLFLTKILELKNKFKGKLNIRSSDPLYAVVSPESMDYIDKPILGGCSAGIASCSVGINGDFQICTRVPYVIGNVITDDLCNLWNSHPDLLKIRNRDLLEGNCGSCAYRWLCGGCRGAALRDKGNIFAEDSQCWISH